MCGGVLTSDYERRDDSTSELSGFEYEPFRRKMEKCK
jgi:hypothetical protein